MKRSIIHTTGSIHKVAKEMEENIMGYTRNNAIDLTDNEPLSRVDAAYILLGINEANIERPPVVVNTVYKCSRCTLSTSGMYPECWYKNFPEEDTRFCIPCLKIGVTIGGKEWKIIPKYEFAGKRKISPGEWWKKYTHFLRNGSTRGQYILWCETEKRACCTMGTF